MLHGYKKLDLLEKAGIVVLSVSPWESPIVVVLSQSQVYHLGYDMC